MNKNVKKDLLTSLIYAAIGAICWGAHAETADFWTTYGPEIAEFVAIILKGLGVCAWVVALVRLLPLIISLIRKLWQRNRQNVKVTEHENEHVRVRTQTKTNVATQARPSDTKSVAAKRRVVQRGRRTGKVLRVR